MFLLQLYITYTDNSVQTVVSDPATWTSGSSALIRNSIYLGEKYDMREEPRLQGWANVGYAASGWTRPFRATRGYSVGRCV